MSINSCNGVLTESVSRRKALRMLGGASAGALLATRLGSAAAQNDADVIKLPDMSAELPTEDTTFRWVDSGDQKKLFYNAFFDTFHEAYPNVTFKYDGLPWAQISQIVPLGVQSGDAPDVFQLPPGITGGQAIQQKWVMPLDDVIPNFDQWKAGLGPNSFFEGINVFGGKTYTFPITWGRGGAYVLYFNKDYMTQAGYDPVTTRFTWDSFRDAAKKITQQGKGKYYGFITGGKQVGYLGAFVNILANMAGASALGDIDYRTGRYVQASDEYVAAAELLLAINDDGSIFPGTLALTYPEARDRMPLGAAGMTISGTYVAALWSTEHPEFAFDVAKVPAPNSGEALPATYAISMNNCWLYAGSSELNRAVAGEIFSYLGSEAGQLAFASITHGSDPVWFANARKQATMDPRTRKTYEIFNSLTRLGPMPVVRNPEVAQVQLELKTVSPGLGDVIQGLLSGQISDVKAALQDLQDRSDKELDRAIKAAQDKGAKVSRDDWVFPNWDPSKDYTADDYAAL